MALGYVYFIRSGKSNLFKIGKTYNLKTRLQQIQVGNPEKVTLFAYVKTNNIDALEDLFHYDGESIRRNGEWFEFHPLDLVDTLQYFVEEKWLMDYTQHLYEPDGSEEVFIDKNVVEEEKKEYEKTHR